MSYYVYIMANKRNGTLYTGVTRDLVKRVYEHKNNRIEGFTEKYGVHMLVYYEHGDDVHKVIEREKQIKRWKRKWKLELIEQFNPVWKDLYFDIVK